MQYVTYAATKSFVAETNDEAQLLPEVAMMISRIIPLIFLVTPPISLYMFVCVFTKHLYIDSLQSEMYYIAQLVSCQQYQNSSQIVVD